MYYVIIIIIIFVFFNVLLDNTCFLTRLGTNTLSASQASQVTPAPANLEGPVAAHDDATKAGDDVLGRGVHEMEVIKHGWLENSP